MPQNASALRQWMVGSSASPLVATRKSSLPQSFKTPWSTAAKLPDQLCATSSKPITTRRTLARNSKPSRILPRSPIQRSLLLQLSEQSVHERQPAHSGLRLGLARHRCRHHHSRRAGDLFFHARQRHGGNAMETAYVALGPASRHVLYFADCL